MPLQIGQRPDHGFAQPLGLLSDCHRRIEHFLRVLLAINREAAGGLVHPGHRNAAEQVTGARVGGGRPGMTLGVGGPLAGGDNGESSAVNPGIRWHGATLPTITASREGADHRIRV